MHTQYIPTNIERRGLIIWCFGNLKTICEDIDITHANLPEQLYPYDQEQRDSVEVREIQAYSLP